MMAIDINFHTNLIRIHYTDVRRKSSVTIVCPSYYVFIYLNCVRWGEAFDTEFFFKRVKLRVRVKSYLNKQRAQRSFN